MTTLTNFTLPVIDALVDIIDFETGHVIRTGTVVGHGTIHRPAESVEDFFDVPARVDPTVLVKLTTLINVPPGVSNPDMVVEIIAVHPDGLRVVR